MVQAAGHNGNYVSISAAAALWLATQPGQAPEAPPTLPGDVAEATLYKTIGFLADRTGSAQVVDAAFAAGKPAAHGKYWDRAYQCADGEWIVVKPIEPKFYAELT
ncbi:hypothetical protein NKJ90_30605 [Mesorhizobium sp. M0051]|uniref:hypothetical protein n=1 Tax=Mesorhizobium sp. M0051 TaxID=2956862 RepID=UPI00333A4BED